MSNDSIRAALRDLLTEIGEPIHMHHARKYGTYQISPDAIDDARAALDRPVPIQSGVSDAILCEAADCANSWDADARLIGNVRAADLHAMLAELRDRRRAERLARYADQIGEARIAEHSQRNAPAEAQEREHG